MTFNHINWATWASSVTFIWLNYIAQKHHHHDLTVCNNFNHTLEKLVFAECNDTAMLSVCHLPVMSKFIKLINITESSVLVPKILVKFQWCHTTRVVRVGWIKLIWSI